MSLVKKTREWDWWAHLFRVTHRESIEGIGRWDDELCAFLLEVLALAEGESVLDVACGSGVHLLRLARHDIRGVGVDVAPSLVRHATERAEEAGLSGVVRYLAGDMRDLGAAVGDRRFAAVTLLSGSFGFFDDATNERVLQGLAARLRSGGRLVMDCVAPAVAKRPARSTWQELAGGYLLEESRFDPVGCALVSGFRYIDGDGVVNLAAEPERIRVYTLPELANLLDRVGLELLAAYGSNALPLEPYGPGCDGRLVVLARKLPRPTLGRG